MQLDQKAPGGRRLATVNQVPTLQGYDWLTSPALRHLIFDAETRFNSRNEAIPGNGLKEVGAIIRIGRKVLIDLDAFDQWVDSHSTAASDHPLGVSGAEPNEQCS